MQLLLLLLRLHMIPRYFLIQCYGPSLDKTVSCRAGLLDNAEATATDCDNDVRAATSRSSKSRRYRSLEVVI